MSGSNVVAEALFNTILKNKTTRRLWVPFIGTWGSWIEPGALFKMNGDPRLWQSPAEYPQNVDMIKKMVEDDEIEIISTPLQVIDNRLEDGKSVVLQVDGSSINAVEVPIDGTTAAQRVIPVVAPAVAYAVSDERFVIDWSAAPGLEVWDAFTVAVEKPDGSTEQIMAGQDKIVTYNAAPGTGEYKFTVTVKAADRRKQEGTQVVCDAA